MIQELNNLKEPVIYYSNLDTKKADDAEGYMIVKSCDHILFRFEV